MGIDLKVLQGGKEDVGTDEWADKVRSGAKVLAGRLEDGYMELAKLLWTIYDTPVDGDPNNGAIFVRWGYKSFSDYVENELGINKKKAQRLRNIWYHLEVQLGDSIEPEVKDRIVALGFSKVRELVRVLTARNAVAWLEKAEELSYQKLTVAVRKYVDDVKEYQARKAIAAEEQGGAPPEDSEEGTGESSGGGGGGSADPVPLDTVIGQPVDFAEPEVPDYKPEAYKQFRVDLEPEQYLVVKDAIDAAEKLSGSPIRSNNFHLICLDFISNNGDGGGSTQSRVKKLVEMASVMGFELVILDEGEVVFGLTTLEKLAGEQ